MKNIRKTVITLIILITAAVVWKFSAADTPPKIETKKSTAEPETYFIDENAKNSSKWQSATEDYVEKKPIEKVEPQKNEEKTAQKNEEAAEPPTFNNEKNNKEAQVDENDNICIMSVCCKTILNNMSLLKPEKHAIVPKDGVIFAQQEVYFDEGESVFDVLLREMQGNKIHLEFENTPLYKSAYIEGIANIYEFDCGNLSGWMYKVNGKVPSCGCSEYILRRGDIVQWVYTCDMGHDVQ